MPEDDVNEHVAQMFHGLVSDLQRGDVERFEAEQKKEREARAALRSQQPGIGMSGSELLKKLDGDPEDAQRRIDEELARINREAKAAADAKDKSGEALPSDHFPPPPTSG